MFRGEFYIQVYGIAMGSPVSLIFCNVYMYMEEFENKALNTTAHPPSWWFCYVDDTCTKQKVQYVQEFTDHLNSIDNDIKFTNELEETMHLLFLRP